MIKGGIGQVVYFVFMRYTGNLSNLLERLHELHPKLYDFVINKLGAKEILDYIKCKY